MLGKGEEMKYVRKMVMVVVLVVLAVTVSSQASMYTFKQGIDGYAGTEDVWLRNWIGWADHSGAELHPLIGKPFDASHRGRNLIRFSNLGSLDGPVASAKLRMKVAYVSGYGFDVNLHEVKAANAEWLSGQTSWSYKRNDWSTNYAWAGSLGCGTAGTDYVASPMDTVHAVSGDADATIYEFDVDPALVQQWVDGGTNAGMLLLADESFESIYYRGFYSAETSSAPELIITTIPEPATFAILFAGMGSLIIRKKIKI